MSKRPQESGGWAKHGSFFLAFLLLTACWGKTGRLTAEDKPNPKNSLAHYLLPFGNNPFAPSEAKTGFTGFLDPAKVPTAAYCGQCHQAIYREWRESAHSNSFRTPWYKKNVDLLIEQKGIEYSRHCEGCHNPAALLSGALTTGSAIARPFDEEGVTCVMCHAIERTQATRGLGSYVMNVPAALLDADGKPVEGMPEPGEIITHLDRHKAAVRHTVLATPELCGSCHKANLPQTLNGYKWLRAFTTYDEWQQSGWSGQSPVAFFKKPVKECRDCHMQAVTGADPAAQNGQYRSHRWAAANTLISSHYGYPDQEKAVEAFLKNGVLRVDIFAISDTGTTIDGKHPAIGTVVAPLEKKAFSLSPGRPVTVSIVVQNTGIGHSFVPEQRDFYESWLAVDITDETGRLIYESGKVGPDRKLEKDAHRFTNQLMDKDGKRLVRHEVWNAAARAYDDTVNAGRASVERYRFTVPKESKSLTIHAAIKYRRVRREFTDWVFSDQPDAPDRGPTVTVAEDTVVLQQGVDGTTRAETRAAKPPDSLRFAAFGIGLLDRAEIPAAEEAFKRMVELEPGKADGYLNVGVALYTEGNFEEAIKWLQRGRALEPGSLRALYYMGLCWRWEYKYSLAIEALGRVAKAYPRFRQVHDDLGWALLIQKRYDAARNEFEAALAVDPDDVVAHKWLSAVYVQLGDKEKASEHAKEEAQMRDDPAAQWRVLAYWREHPDVAREVTPGHVHGAPDNKETERILNTANPPSMVWIQR